MNQLLVIGAMMLCLAACGTQRTKDDAPASDLVALKASVQENLPRRTLPNGKIYCAELAATNDDRDECTLDLEDLVFMLTKDRERALRVLGQGIERLERARRPCGAWARFWGLDRCDPGAPVTP